MEGVARQRRYTRGANGNRWAEHDRFQTSQNSRGAERFSNWNSSGGGKGIRQREEMEEEEEEEDEEGGEGKAESHVPLSIYVRSDIPSRVRPTSGEGVRLAL